MNSEAFTRDDPSFVSPTLTRDELVNVITELRTVNAELEGEVLRLKARIEELEGLVNKPPRNPRNSSVPPSRGEKENKKPGERKVRRKRGFGARRGLR